MCPKSKFVHSIVLDISNRKSYISTKISSETNLLDEIRIKNNNNWVLPWKISPNNSRSAIEFIHRKWENLRVGIVSKQNVCHLRLVNWMQFRRCPNSGQIWNDLVRRWANVWPHQIVETAVPPISGICRICFIFIEKYLELRDSWAVDVSLHLLDCINLNGTKI